MNTELFEIYIIQTRRYGNENKILHYAQVTHKETGKTVKDWFCSFNEETLNKIKNLNWSDVTQ
jgi:hypothetical protein